MSSVAVDYLKKRLLLTLGKTARKEFQDLYRSLASFPWLHYGQQYKELKNNVIRPPRKHAPLRYYIPFPYLSALPTYILIIDPSPLYSQKENNGGSK